MKEAYGQVAADRAEAKIKVSEAKTGKLYAKLHELEKELSKEKARTKVYKGAYATLSICMEKFKASVLSFLKGSRLAAARDFMRSDTYKLAQQDVRVASREEGFFSCVGQLNRVNMLSAEFDPDTREDLHPGRREDLTPYPDEEITEEMHEACEFGEQVTDPEVPYPSKPAYLPAWVPECLRSGILYPFEKEALCNAAWVKVGDPVIGRAANFVEP